MLEEKCEIWRVGKSREENIVENTNISAEKKKLDCLIKKLVGKIMI